MTPARRPMMTSVLFLVEDYQRLWAVTGFAERFAARLAWPGVARELAGDPYQAVLGEHRRRLAARLRADGLAGNCRPDDLADALTGFYLSRRLAGAKLEGWVPSAIATIIGVAGTGGGDVD